MTLDRGWSPTQGQMSMPGPPLHPSLAPKTDKLLIHLATMEQVSRHWDWIRHGILHVKRKTQIRNRGIRLGLWEPQHIRRDVEAGWNSRTANPPQPAIVEMWLAMRGEKPVAFTVTELVVDRWAYIPVGMTVWLAYNHMESGALRDKKRDAEAVEVVSQMDQFLENVARARGLEYLEAYTRRPSLPKRLAEMGWSSHFMVLRKPLYRAEEG